MEDDFSVIAYYAFTPVEDPDREVKEHKKLLETLNGKGRIYISEEGINAQLSVPKEAEEEYSKKVLERFPTADIKVHRYPTHPFAKLVVKRRRQLVAMDETVSIEDTGVHLNSEEWAEMLLHRDENTLLIDTRNDYEWKVGHFDGADLPNLSQFRDFPEYARQLSTTHDPEKTKVMMYCTGGIRCELYSALMKKIGFKDVYQLNGGIIRYGLEKGNDHWKGKLFVFDDRLVVPISEDSAEAISECQFCQCAVDRYYNCANMDCNALMIACSTCMDEHHGCCCKECEEAPRVRPFSSEINTTPFRKLSFEEKKAIEEHAVSTH